MTSIDVNEVGTGVESNLAFNSILKRQANGTLLASAIDATAASNAQAILQEPVSGKLIAIFQLGSTGSVGLCFATSSDLGQTWSAAVQISSKQNVFPAAVINPSTGDVHLCYARRGFPDTSSGNSTYGIFYRVLSWNGTTWSAGGEITIQAATASVEGYTNVTLGVDENGFLVAAYLDQLQGSITKISAAISDTAWDLSTNTKVALVTLTEGAVARVGIQHADEIDYWLLWIIQNGTIKLYTSTSILSVSNLTLSFAQSTSFFIADTDQVAFAWNPAPEGALFGQSGITYNNAGNVLFRTWTPQSNILSSATVLNVATAAYPTVAAAVGIWYVGWTEQISGNQYKIQLVRSDNLTAVYTLDSDNGSGDTWGWLRFPWSVGGINALPMMWSDQADPEVDGYNVHLGMVSIEVLRLVNEVAHAVESILAGPVISDTGTADDSALSAGEMKTVTDTGTALDAPGLNPQLPDSGQIAETFATGIASSTPEQAAVAERFDLQVAVAISDTGAVTELALLGPQKVVADVAHANELLNALLPRLEAAVAQETLGIGIQVFDTGTVGETAIPGILLSETAVIAETIVSGPNLTDQAHALDGLVIELGVRDSGHASEASPTAGPIIQDSVVVSETLNAGQIGGTPHYSILSITGQHYDFFTGVPGGWSGRALVSDNTHTRLFVFEDIDSSYTNIVFSTTPLGLLSYTPLKRSIDGGKTFFSVGPQSMAYVAHAPDGSLWGVGNDGTQPAQPAPPPYGLPDGTGDFGWAGTQRQVFHSTDKGQSWTKIFDDGHYGQFGRYPSYTHIAVNDGGVVLAIGIARGNIDRSELQVLRQGGLAGWETVSISTAMMAARLVGDPFAMHVSDTLFAAVGPRFVWGSNFPTGPGGLFIGPDRLWTTDDHGSTWDLRFSDEIPGGVSAPPCDITYRGGIAYAVRNDTGNSSPTKQIIRSTDFGLNWQSVPSPTLTGLPGGYTAVAYDYKLGTLYVGSGNNHEPIARMDNAPGGGWENVLFNLEQAADDQSPRTSFGGIGVLSGLVLSFDVFVSDHGHASDSAGQIYHVDDTAIAVETLSLSLSNAVTIRLYLHSGRLRLRMLGATEPTVNTNPGE